jgi:hypothetical protein
MADFRMVSSQAHLSFSEDDQQFALDPGYPGDAALWGGGPAGEALRVESTDPGVVQVVSVAPPLRGSDLRWVRLMGLRIGAACLNARVPSTNAVWASAEVVVGFTPGKMVTPALSPVSGAIPFAIGAAALVRIPVPGTNGLCIELSPRGWTPKGGSTSTLFIQDALGKRNLRLDYGFNRTTNSVNYHWNQKGTFDVMGVVDHTPVGAAGRITYKAARYFKYAGRTVAIVGAAVDIYSVVTATKPLRQATKVAAGWGGAWLGCKVVGAGGAWVGTAVTPGLGTAIGGVAGCLAGAFIGYEGASETAGRLYDWGEAQFVAAPETVAP